MAGAQGPVAAYPSRRQRCLGWAEPRAAGTSPGAQHAPEPCRRSWHRCQAPRHARTAVTRRKSLRDRQNSSGPVLCGFVPYAEAIMILPSSDHVLSARGVTKERWGTLTGSQRLQPSIPCSGSWFPNSPQTLGRSGKETGLSSATRNYFETCRCNMGSYFPLESRSKSLCSSSTLHPGHLHSIPPPAHPGTQEVPEHRALALAAGAGELQPAHPALHRTAPGPLQHRASPHTHSLHLFQRVY